jgi:hypothetical protein
VPVMLWTITAFVRNYVGPPHIPTFHQLAAIASINAPSAGAGPEAMVQLPQGGGGSGAVVEALATATDARDAAAPKGDRPAEADAQGTTPAGTFPPSALAAPDGNEATVAPTSGKMAAGADDGSEFLTASQPLSGPIPLPRPRPHDAEMRTADNALSNVPMPRRRPEGAGPGAPAETTGSNPLGFIQNIFH